MRNEYRILVGKLQWMRQCMRPRSRCEDNIKVGRIEIRMSGCWSDSTGSRQNPW